MKIVHLLAATALTIGLAACNKGEGGNTAAGGGSAPAAVTAPNGDWSQAVSQTPEGGMLLGNPNAKVRLVEFGSMTCSHCADFAVNGEPKLVEQFIKTGNVSFEFRNYVRDPVDITMALIARCAGATPQFFKLTNGMFADQKAIFERLQSVPQAQLQQLQSLPPAQQFQQTAQLAGLQEWAAQRGLPSAKTQTCLANQAEIDRLVQMNSDATSQYQIQGTPTFLINNEVAKGNTFETLLPEIQAALGS